MSGKVAQLLNLNYYDIVCGNYEINYSVYFKLDRSTCIIFKIYHNNLKSY